MVARDPIATGSAVAIIAAAAAAFWKKVVSVGPISFRVQDVECQKALADMRSQLSAALVKVAILATTFAASLFAVEVRADDPPPPPSATESERRSDRIEINFTIRRDHGSSAPKPRSRRRPYSAMSSASGMVSTRRRGSGP